MININKYIKNNVKIKHFNDSNSVSFQKPEQDSRLNLLNVTTIVDASEFFLLKDSWNKLLNQTPEPFPFLSWEWLYTWWEIFAQSKDQLQIILIHNNDDQLVGIAPFYIKNKTFGTVLKSLGEGEADYEAIVTHYQDIICEKHNSAQIVSTIMEYLNANKTWDYSEFSFVLDNSNLLTLMEKLDPSLNLNSSLGNRYILDLKRSFEELYLSLGRSSKKAFRSKKNRMQKEGELSLESIESIDEGLDIHSFFHTHRQQVLGREGQFLLPRFRQFHSSLHKRLETTGKADIRVLKVGDDPIACTLNYVSKDADKPMVYSYSSGYKSSDDARLSPMFIFDMLEFEYLIENNVTSYDFLSSTDVVSYKDTYRCDTQAVVRIRWFEMTAFGLAYYMAFKARKTLSPVKTYVTETIPKSIMYVRRFINSLILTSKEKSM